MTEPQAQTQTECLGSSTKGLQRDQKNGREEVRRSITMIVLQGSSFPASRHWAGSFVSANSESVVSMSLLPERIEFLN